MRMMQVQVRMERAVRLKLIWCHLVRLVAAVEMTAVAAEAVVDEDAGEARPRPCARIALTSPPLRRHARANTEWPEMRAYLSWRRPWAPTGEDVR